MSYGYFERLDLGGFQSDRRRAVEALADAATLGTAQIRQHVLTVAGVSVVISSRLNLPEEDVEVLVSGALLHDVGKLGVPHEILVKQGTLTDDEWKVVKQHPVTGAELVRSLDIVANISGVVRHHHERFDGLGYPDGLSGKEIPLLARIVTVADSVGAMILDRPYRHKLPRHRIVAELRENSGTQFDPEIVAAALESLNVLDQLDIPGRFA